MGTPTLAAAPKTALIVVTDGSGAPARVHALGMAAARGGAWALMLREPGFSGRAAVAAVAALERDAPQLRVLVSDRADVALASSAAGVQLGERGLPAGRVKQRWPALAVGRSVHDVDGARQANAHGADWLVFGHVYPTPSKPGEAPRGLDALRRVVDASRVPVIAIGGIDCERIAAVMATGAHGVAVIGAVAGAREPQRAVGALVERLRHAGGGETE